MVMSEPLWMPSSFSRHVALASFLESNADSPRKNDMLSSPVLCLCGTSARQACADGQTVSPGVLHGSPVPF
jgi:hypothetical protein